MKISQQRPVEAIQSVTAAVVSTTTTSTRSARTRVHRIARPGTFEIPDPRRHGRAPLECSLAGVELGLEDSGNLFWSEQR